ncbi:MAG: TatD family hydrolase [Spirulinaceae cyanobacterium SM2_1_0]|nr:TatD family hydrolase [Spirulinaceae cyanobacterium SM2_1_0]
MPLIDTHVHLNFATFEEDFAAVRSRWQEAGVVQLVHSCVEPTEFATTQALADRCPELSFAVGLHPLDVHKWERDAAIALIRQHTQSDPRVVAIGELGLDFYKADNVAHQQDLCRAQMELAIALDKPVIIHCRDAAEPLRDLIVAVNQSRGQRLRGVMHCWSGTPTETQWFLDLGFYISFSGIVTFKKATTVQASAKLVPAERLLIETDCPFLAPVPRRGKRNEPAFVSHVAAAVAALRETAVEAIAAQTTANARRLFGLATLPVETVPGTLV